MKSTGEVMGIDYDFGRAYYKACISADNELPLEGNVFISVDAENKEGILPAAQNLHELGLKIFGTEGTVAFLESRGIPASLVRKVQEGSPNVIDVMRRGELRLIINAPSGKYSRQDHVLIMRAALDYNVPYITTIQAANAAAQAIRSLKKDSLTIEPLSHYHGLP
jgi:carbamoyl-phosphate synthase large subunit